ncbi:hypothetical protein [Sphingobium sp. YC-XJ3]|uniref:hypothetical protein n=2 Tax=unclassified Sphingobium TaxID=2611147 RepID=UPI00235F27A8|nr:hypothetical protein [Sphingobium sp. YC-XJ3]WDA36439.1 hypothetical protein PO876_23920 [Sphingobium sp. YC-XJ3]
MTPDQLNDLIADQRESGATYREIADRLTGAGHPITKDAVAWRCRKMGLFREQDRARYGNPVGGRSFTPLEDQTITEMRLAGASIHEIGTAIGRRYQSVYVRLFTLARLDELNAA